MTDRERTPRTADSERDRKFWEIVRQAALLFVDAIERRYRPGDPRTADLRRERKRQSREEC